MGEGCCGWGRLQGGQEQGCQFRKMVPGSQECHLWNRTKYPLESQVAPNWDSAERPCDECFITCIYRDAGLANHQLRGNWCCRVKLVQPFGNLEELAGAIHPIHESVNEEHNSSGCPVVSDSNGAF